MSDITAAERALATARRGVIDAIQKAGDAEADHRDAVAEAEAALAVARGAAT